MANLYVSRRREARAINSGNLSWSESAFADVDYVVARGMSGSELGSKLERLKYGMDRSAYGPCADLLSEKFSRRTKGSARRSLVHAALHEYVDDQCAVCGGRNTDAVEGAIGCLACKGTGLRTYTDAERAHMASIAAGAWRKNEPDYLILLDCLRSAVAAHRRGMSRVLADPVETGA